MNDMKDELKATIDTAKTEVAHGVESAREGAGKGLATAVGAMVRAVNTVSGVLATLRALDRDDGLAWIGLARRRPLRSAVMFASGLTMGAGLGVLFAPMAGAEMRRTLLARLTPAPKPAAGASAASQAEKASNGAHPPQFVDTSKLTNAAPRG
jgi:hypothetical protein